MFKNAFSVSAVLHGVMLFVLAGGAARGEDSAPLALTATIPQEACTMVFDPAQADMGPIPSNGLPASGGTVMISATKEVKLTLRHCGVGATATRPAVTITAGRAAVHSYLFKNENAPTTSKNFYIVIGKKAAPKFTGTDLYQQKDTLSFSGGGTGSSGEGLTTSVFFGVTCWNDDSCKAAQAGTLQANITFTAAYR